MPAPIDFYFDFASPYGYIASHKIDAIAAKNGREATWRPFLLGAAFKITGGAAPIQFPMKGDYFVRDFARSARYHGVPFKYPSKFPISSVAPTRAFYWLNARDPKRAKDLVRALYAAYFTADIDISDAEQTIRVAAQSGLGADEVRAGINDQAVKDLTKAEVEKAIAAGAFGSPYIVVDGEPFWGADRLDQVERWLATGGF
jgi:2-hydroxychromene-2-carboxylate isomerase